jgi:glycosyltransferase involved in cell wall biosynthesis
MTAGHCRVLYVVFDGTLGGSLASCADFIRHTDRAVVDVTFCMLGGRGVTSDAIAAMGVEVVSFGASSWHDVAAAAAFVRFLRRRRFDVVHNNARTMFGHAALAIAGRKSALIYQEHGDIHTHGTELAARVFYRLFTWLYDRFLTVGDETLEAMVAEGVPRRLITNLASPVDLDHFSPGLDRGEAKARIGLPAAAVIVGTACRLVHQKDLGLFLETAGRVSAVDDDVRFVIAGEGEEEQTLRDQARALGLEARVAFIGNRTDMPVLWRAFDLFLLTSRQESFGRTILESLASATPIVGVRPAMGGGRILDAAEGVRVAAGRDAGELSALVLRLCGDRTARERLGAAGRRWVETQREYRVENWAARLRQVYLDLAATRG